MPTLTRQPHRLPTPYRGLPWVHLLSSWVVARVVVGLAVWWARPVAETLHQPRSRHAMGLLGWDASWYDRIAHDGYAHLPRLGLRFFPLLPLLARGLGTILLGHPGLALLLLANGAALLLAVLVHRLALQSGLGPDAAVRAVWAVSLAPAAFVLVLGYAEPVWACLVAGCLLALRDRRWALAAALALLAATARPTGVLLVVPAVVEALRHRRPGALLAALAAVAGLGSYLAWVGARFGDPLLPFTVQADPSLRGGLLVDPLPGLRDGLLALPDTVVPVVAHLPWVLLALLLLATGTRRLPLSFTAYSAASLALALTAAKLGSFERYAGTTVPLLLAASVVTRPRLPRAALAAAGVLTGATYAALALGGSATP